jgi:hypothetical protein
MSNPRRQQVKGMLLWAIRCNLSWSVKSSKGCISFKAVKRESSGQERRMRKEVNRNVIDKRVGSSSREVVCAWKP